MEIIILSLIIILIIIIIFLQNKDSFLNKTDYITRQLKESISARLNIHKMRIINLYYEGDIYDGYINVSFDLLPGNDNINEISNKKVLEKINELIKDDIFYVRVNEKNLKIKSFNKEKEDDLISKEESSMQNSLNKELLTDTEEKNPNKLLIEAKDILKDKIRGMPFNHNLERYYKIDHDKQVLIEPPELIIEEENILDEEN